MAFSPKSKAEDLSQAVAYDVKGTTEVDAHVGQRLRLRRTILGMKQDELADAVGVTYQQIQKYERGETRLTIGRLLDIGLILGVSIDWFVDGLPGGVVPKSGMTALADDRDVRELVRLFSSADSPKVRRRFLALARALVQDDEDPAF